MKTESRFAERYRRNTVVAALWRLPQMLAQADITPTLALNAHTHTHADVHAQWHMHAHTDPELSLYDSCSMSVIPTILDRLTRAVWHTPHVFAQPP